MANGLALVPVVVGVGHTLSGAHGEDPFVIVHHVIVGVEFDQMQVIENPVDGAPPHHPQG